MQTSAQGSITLMKTREGSSFSVWLSSDKPLFQLFTVTNGHVTDNDVMPNWTADGNAPTVTVNASDGVVISNVEWRIDDTKASILDLTGTDSEHHTNLVLNKNMATDTYRQSRTLKAIIALTDGNGNNIGTVTKTEVIRIQQAVPNGITVYIDTPDGQNVPTPGGQPVHLIGKVYEGIREADYSEYKLGFYKAGTTENLLRADRKGQTEAERTLEVNVAMVDGATTFICRCFKGTEEQDAEAVVIFDTSDEYRISATVTPRVNTTEVENSQVNVTGASIPSQYDNAKVTFKVVNSGGVEKSGVSDWKVQKYHSETMRLIKNNGRGETTTSPTDTEDTFSEDTGAGNTSDTNYIIVYDRDYLLTNSGSGAHDTNVVVTASVNLNP